jgi:large subunit ribosomal protein L13e
MKHNNAIAHEHFHKHWCPASAHKGHVRTWFNQPGRKKRRRATRVAKAKEIFPRPIAGALRPVVMCPTQRYNMKPRSGRGFSLQEVKSVGLSAKYARSIGIAVDVRRINRSEESLALNKQRLQTYLSKLVLFPTSKRVAKKTKRAGAADKFKQLKANKGSAVQDLTRKQVSVVPLPKVAGKAAHEAPRALTAEEKAVVFKTQEQDSKTNYKTAFLVVRKARLAHRFKPKRAIGLAKKKAKQEAASTKKK